MALSIQNLSMLLSVSLVISTGVLIGSLAVTNGKRSTTDARETGQRGVNTCLNGATENVEVMSGRFVDEVLARVHTDLLAYLTVPETMLEQLLHFVKAHDPDLTTNPDWIDQVFRPVFASLHWAASQKGVRSSGYHPLNFSANSDQDSWGGELMFFLGDETQGSPPADGSAFHSVLETRNPVTGRFENNNENFTIGTADRLGHLNTLGGTRVECLNDGQRNFTYDVLGRCVYPWFATETPKTMELTSRAMSNINNGGPLVEPNVIHFSPLVTTVNYLQVYAYSSWTHPKMINKYPNQENRVGWLRVAITTGSVQDLVQDQDLPAKSILYIVEKDPWTGEIGNLLGLNTGSVTEMVALPFSLPGRKNALPIHILNHPDPLVSAHGRLLLSSTGGYDEALRLSRYSFISWEVNGTVYWYQTALVSRPGGLAWYVNLIVSRDIIMADLDASVQRISATTQEEQDAADARSRETFVVMISVVTCVALGLLVVSVIFVRIIVNPIRSLQESMSDVARMKLDLVDLNAPFSRLEEVASMQDSFSTMVKNLIEYRQYMPQSVLVPSDSSDHDDHPTSEGTQSASWTDSRSTPVPQQSVDAVGNMLRSDAIRKKNITICFFNVIDFSSVMQRSSEEMRTVHTKLIALLYSSVQGEKGVCEPFMGDRMLATFNAVTQVSTHRVRAACAAVKTRNAEEVGGRISFALVGGEAKVGNAGCAGMKKFTIFSSVVPWAVALETHNKNLGASGLIDRWVEGDIYQNFVCRHVDVVSFSKFSSDPVRVSEVLGHLNTTRHGEWMYQLQDLDNHPVAHWNNAFLSMLNGDWGQADSALSLSEPFFECDTLAERFRRRITEKECQTIILA